MRRFVKKALVGLLPLALAGAAEARITRVQINSRAVAFGGASFGSVGQYETLRGVVFGEVDPNDPLNEGHRHQARAAQRPRNGRVQRGFLAEQAGGYVEG